jgi:signal transduction histidine kinase
MIDDLLDHTRITQGKLQLETRPCDVHDLLWQVHRSVQFDAEAKGISLTMQLNARETCVEGGPARIQQILWNPLKNAIKFTGDGGWVILRTNNAPRPPAPVDGPSRRHRARRLRGARPLVQ